MNGGLLEREKVEIVLSAMQRCDARLDYVASYAAAWHGAHFGHEAQLLCIVLV